MTSVPTIRSEGPPPERHAARVVGEMCQWLVGAEPHMRLRMAKAIALAQGRRRDGLGSPKAQARFERRMKAGEAGRMLLGMTVERGSRGRYGIRMLYWTLMAPGGQELLLQPPGTPPPEKPWLAAIYEEMWPKTPEKDRHAFIVILTHHAMQRLAERCEARHPVDLLAALRDIAIAMFTASPERLQFESECRLAFPGGVAIVEHVDKLGWLVKTVLPADATI